MNFVRKSRVRKNLQNSLEIPAMEFSVDLYENIFVDLGLYKRTPL